MIWRETIATEQRSEAAARDAYAASVAETAGRKPDPEHGVSHYLQRLGAPPPDDLNGPPAEAAAPVWMTVAKTERPPSLTQ